MGRGRPHEVAVRLPAVARALGPVARELVRGANRVELVSLRAVAIDFTGDDGGDAGLLDGCALFLLSQREADGRADSGDVSPEWFWMPHFWDGPWTIVAFASDLRRSAEAAVRDMADALQIDPLFAKGLFFDIVGREVVTNRDELAHSTGEDFVVFAARHQNFAIGVLDSISWTAGARVTGELQRVGLLPTQDEADGEGDEWSRLE